MNLFACANIFPSLLSSLFQLLLKISPMSMHIHVLPWSEIVRWEVDRGICRLAVISLSDVVQIMRDNLMPPTPASLHISPVAKFSSYACSKKVLEPDV